MEPGPIPTLTASTPRSMRARHPSAVATLPAISCMSGYRSRTARMVLRTSSECPCDVSIQMASAWASTRASNRAKASAPVPTAAAARNRPKSSLHALGNSIFFIMSLMVMRPRSLKSSSTTRSFSILCTLNCSMASSSVVPTGTVTRFSEVMSSVMGRVGSFSNRTSRLVTMPARVPSGRTMGTPEIRYSAINASASPYLAVRGRVMGSTIIPASLLLTLRTISA